MLAKLMKPRILLIGVVAVVTLFAVAAVLLVAFVIIEQRVAHPLLPLRVVLERNRGGSFLASLLVGVAMLGTFLSLTYYFQGTLHYSALKSGFAFVPFSLGIISGATLASRFLPRFGPRIVMTGGLLLATAGLVLFSTLDVHSAYISVVLPAEVNQPERRSDPRPRRDDADDGQDGRPVPVVRIERAHPGDR